MTSTPKKTIGISNQHVKEYLEFYLSLSYAPHFAVALNGAWGIGKTYLVKRVLQEHFSGKKDEYVYVSLYGLATTEEIDNALFVAMHPALARRDVKVASRVIKSALKFMRIESDLESRDFLNKFKSNVYVFDDLERCELKPLNRVLGYINEFVEHDNCKVIIVANEKEIDHTEDYLRRREKLIGKTLEVKSSFEEALSQFTSSVLDSATRLFLEQRTDEISSIYQQSELYNLRLLQQTIWDFERVFCSISQGHRTKAVAMIVLLQIFFAFSLEVKSGRIGPTDLQGRMNGLASALARLNKDSAPTPMQNAEKRYSGVDLGNSILSNEVLIDILVSGIVAKGDIRNSLDQSTYFISPETEPAWRTVWHAYERTEEEFDKALMRLEAQFAQREFLLTGEILHVFGLRLWLSDVGAIALTRLEVVGDCRKYVNDLYAEKRLEPILIEDFHDAYAHGYGGLGIFQNDTEEYKQLNAYLSEKRYDAGKAKYPDLAKELLKELEVDPQLYYRRLCVTNSSDNIYYSIPILASISPKTFVDLVLKMSPMRRRTVFSAFKGRYGHGFDNHLVSEKKWLNKVRGRLAVKAINLSPMSKFQLENLIKWFVDPYLESQFPEAEGENGE